MTTTATDLPRADDDEDDDPPRPNRRRTVAVVVAATVLVAALLVWLVAYSSVFGVRKVDVRGVHVLTAAQVSAAADVDHGTPLVRIDTSAVTRRVERLPEIASVEVSTSFPSTLVIRVTEREPVGYVRRSGHAVLVDRTGDQYRTVAAALPAPLRRQVRSIEALDPAAITLVLTRDRVVAWGSAQRSADKARVLPVLLRQKHDHQPVRHVDVTDPDQPFTR